MSKIVIKESSLNKWDWGVIICSIIPFISTIAIPLIILHYDPDNNHLRALLGSACGIIILILIRWYIHSKKTKKQLDIIINDAKQKNIEEEKIKNDNYKRMSDHFPRFAKISTEIKQSIKDKSMSNDQGHKKTDNDIDKIIESPLRYVNQTLNGNEAPKFNADDSYMNAIFDKDVKYIVAITAEDPNLWLDPTLCFYMTNCYAVSVMRQANKENNQNKKMVVRDFSEEQSLNVFNKKRKDVLDDLSSTGTNFFDNGFEFVRFFLYNKEQKECCENTVFPSLKAAQDLFNTQSYFIQKDAESFNSYIQQNYSYNSLVQSIWTLFKKHNFAKEYNSRIESRIASNSPEFLVLFKKSKIIIYTYINGEAFFEEEKYNDSNVTKLIQHLATYIKNNNYHDDWECPEEKMINNKASFLDWE